MRVYRLKKDVDHYQYFVADGGQMTKLYLNDTPCKPVRSIWQPPSVYILRPFLTRGDFYQFHSNVLITSPRATDILRFHLMAAGELLDLPYDGQVYTVLNVTECINVLDQDKTVWDFSDDIRLNIKQYAFHANRFQSSQLFKIPETCGAEILLADGLDNGQPQFRDLAIKHGLEGMYFELLWETALPPRA